VLSPTCFTKLVYDVNIKKEFRLEKKELCNNKEFKFPVVKRLLLLVESCDIPKVLFFQIQCTFYFINFYVLDFSPCIQVSTNLVV